MLGVMLALALVGAAAGFAAADLAPEDPTAVGGTAIPVPASSPSIPVDPPARVLPDPPAPPLDPALTYRPATVGGRLFGVTVPVPQGWEKFSLASAENRWTLPGNPDHSYSLRVEMVFGQRQTIAQILAARAADLQSLTEFTVLDRSADTLVFRYIDSTEHARLQILRWIAPRATGTAEVEVAVSGRLVDEEGLQALLDTVASGARVPG